MSVSSALRRVVGISSVFLLFLIAISVLRALMWVQPPVSDYCSSEDKDYVSDTPGLFKRFSEALKFQTISYKEHVYERAALSNFTTYLFKSK